MATKIAGELYYDLDGQLLEIKRQLRQPNGYPFDPEKLKLHLQNAIEGRFGSVNGAKKLSLKFLELIAGNIAINTAAFPKDSFFSKNGPVKLYFGDNFSNWILAAMPDVIPAFEGTLLKTRLTKYMYDSEILDELGHPEPFTISEFSAIVRELLQKQPNGEDGILLNNGYANIFFVQLEDARVVAVRVLWGSGRRAWSLIAPGLDDGRWSDGRCVFSRS